MTTNDAIAIIKTIAKHAIDSGVLPAPDIVDATAEAAEALRRVETLSPSLRPDIRITIAANIRSIMVREEVTPAMLADWTGLHLNTIRRITTGATDVQASTLETIASVFKRPVKDFFEE